jgi:hypothetical protein
MPSVEAWHVLHESSVVKRTVAQSKLAGCQKSALGTKLPAPSSQFHSAPRSATLPQCATASSRPHHTQDAIWKTLPRTVSSQCCVQLPFLQ